jgi:hypothetical protein
MQVRKVSSPKTLSIMLYPMRAQAVLGDGASGFWFLPSREVAVLLCIVRCLTGRDVEVQRPQAAQHFTAGSGAHCKAHLTGLVDA